MANVFDAAKYILERTGPITTMKLQKLLYYAQAWSLVWDDEELFPEEFEAWANGPVCKELYDWHAGRFKVAADDVPSELLSTNGDPFTESQKETMDIIIRDYGNDTGHMLSELSHREAPWCDARRGLAPGMRCSNIITKESMYMYYDALQA